MAASKQYKTWSSTEIISLIHNIQELDCLAILDGKRQRNKDVYTKVAENLNSPGKDMEACRAKYKKLKERYKEERAICSKSGKGMYLYVCLYGDDKVNKYS